VASCHGAVPVTKGRDQSVITPNRACRVILQTMKSGKDHTHQEPPNTGDRVYPFLPRLIRLRDAPAYLGMDRNKFGAMVRPYLTEIPLGTQAIAFDRLEIEAWASHYIECNGRRPKASLPEDDTCQNATKCRDYASEGASGTLKNAVSTVKTAGSMKVREHLAGRKQKST